MDYAGTSGPMTPAGNISSGSTPGQPNLQQMMGQIALAYIQNAMQQSQQPAGTTSNDPGNPVVEALENATGQDIDGDGDGTGVQSTPPGGKSLQTAHANQPNNGTLPLGTVGPQGMAMPQGIGGTGGMPFVRGRSGGGSASARASSGGGGGRMGSRGSKSKAPPVGKIKTPPKEGKSPPPA